ncbi:MAG: endopeptidase La [Candidatus Metalachnospira sp.]|nr:endopeptidase La [Candidatus Metalachnospira sp.]
MEDNSVGLPMIAVRGVVVFPDMVTSLPIISEKSISALKLATGEYKNEVILSTQKNLTDSDVSVNDFYKVGIIAKIKQTLMLPGNSTHIIIEGATRVAITNILDDGKVFFANGEKIPQDSEVEYDEVTIAYMRVVSDAFVDYCKLSDIKLNIQEQIMSVTNAVNPGQLADIIASVVNLPVKDKQYLLEIFDGIDRLKAVYEKMSMEISVLNLKKEIEKRVKKNMEKAQRDYFLREELKIIHEELGDVDEVQEEIEKYQNNLNALDAPQNVKNIIEKEVLRLKRIPITSPDANVVRNYIDYMMSIPWNKKTKEVRDLINAQKILDEDHYGLKKVKERITEYLAVRMNTEETNSTILCLVGPPGVGKTSIAKSIAKALNRKYVRMSLGGVRDEAEIRGHRKTYVSAMPGRIINAMKQAGTVNPLMLLDEVDKLASSYQGDPAAALLEVLDSEQNNTFRDNYIEVEYDLSKVLFICTANDASQIPPPLKDRMEIIEISGYTAEEKKQIAIRHLIPKQFKENGLKRSQLKIGEDAVDAIINGYCREAGVRKLERIIGKLCRIAVKEILTGEKKSVKISEKNIEKYLGVAKYKHDDSVEAPLVGVVRGLAWTQVGGETLLVEVNTMKGTGKLELTGHMGDVMQESAKVALAYIRSKASLFGIDEGFYKETDINLHIPEGAVPKDGPSAGITMTTAMVSALIDKPVRNDIAMTGEVTIRGRVLAIGGLNEKVLAAKRIGIKNIILPEANNGDIKEMDDEIKNGMNFIFVKEMNQVLDNVFIGGI